MQASHRIKAARIVPLREEEINGFLSWLLNADSERPATLNESFQYAVLQCTDSLVWGVFEANVWHWASEADRDTRTHAGVRPPSRKTLLEARVFGQGAKVPEVLIWRMDYDTERFAGRLLGDLDKPLPEDSPYRPLTREASFLPPEHHAKKPSSANPQHLVADTAKTVVNLGDGRFVQRTMPDGRITVTPPGRAVTLLDYPEEDEVTGILRVAATRFVNITEISEAA